MILIADSGSTKTHWVLMNKTGEIKQEKVTSGINPFLLTEKEIREQLDREMNDFDKAVSKIYFYGAGCIGEKQKLMQNLLSDFFQIETIEVYSDLFAVAHSLCQKEEGIACILGTGSNSCYYDGKQVVQQTPSLGFILGDEGSGSYLGKRLISDWLKGQLSEKLSEAFQEKHQLTQSQVLEQVYRQPFPNRFLAGFTVFLRENIHYPEVESLIAESFRQFIRRNLLQYPKVKELPIHFTGSIAWIFQDILKDVLIEEELQLGKILRQPMEGLIEHHS